MDLQENNGTTAWRRLTLATTYRQVTGVSENCPPHMCKGDRHKRQSPRIATYQQQILPANRP